ncbi:MAG: hypothetical protein FWC70_10110 [Defluviitaleaceae bacterium]|nr:hypothetical protein [Defluviitaleaceae bacterium]
MTRLEFLTVIRSLKKLHDLGKPEAALEVMNEILEDANAEKKTGSKQD